MSFTAVYGGTLSSQLYQVHAAMRVQNSGKSHFDGFSETLSATLSKFASFDKVSDKVSLELTGKVCLPAQRKPPHILAANVPRSA